MNNLLLELPKKYRQHQRTLEKDGVCWNITVNNSECTNLGKHEKEEPMKFPLQVVSGIPGSGNDWILWMASINSKNVIINIITVVLVTVFMSVYCLVKINYM